MTDYSVQNEPDYARTYTEDETVEVRKGDLRALLDVATGSMDFGSGFLCEEEVEALHVIAGILGIDKIVVTPHNFVCKYHGRHSWKWATGYRGLPDHWYCHQCGHRVNSQPDSPPPDDYWNPGGQL